MQRDLWGKTALDYSIEILRTFEPPEGYYLAFSGGKDSVCIKALADIAGVKYDAHYNLTTVDPPELVHFIRDQHPDVEIHRPEQTMWQLIVKKGMLPTRIARWCCEELKERGGHGRLVVTGVRSAESPRRRARNVIEVCRRDVTQKFIHCIKQWTDADVWNFIRENNIAYCSLYDEGFRRLGCILCPFTRHTAREAARWPKVAEAWHRAAIRAFESARVKKMLRYGADGYRVDFADGEAYWQWWLDRDASLPKTDKDQCMMFD